MSVTPSTIRQPSAPTSPGPGPRFRWGNQDLEDHWQAMAAVDKAIVLAFDAPASGIMVPNDYVAGYVAQPPGKARRLRQRRPGQA